MQRKLHYVGSYSEAEGTPNKLARGCIHSKTTLKIRNTYEGSLDIDGCSVAIISYVSTLSTSDAKHIDFQNNAQGVKYSYSESEVGTYSLRHVLLLDFYKSVIYLNFSDLVVVSGQPAIDIFLTNGVSNSSGMGEIDAQFSGVSPSLVDQQPDYPNLSEHLQSLR